MSNQPSYKKILEHPDREEIIAKLTIGQSTTDINEWLKGKYTTVAERKFVLSERMLKSFKDTYLDFYSDVMQDASKTKNALATGTSAELDLAVKNNPAYKDAMIKLANNELNVEEIMARMVVNLETRLAQIYDVIQADPNNIDTRTGRLMGEYIDTLGNLLDKYHKWHEGPATSVVQHNVTLQVVDQHISVFHDVIKEVLSQMDLETSLYFMEVFKEKMAKLKMPDPGAPPSTDMKLAEVKLLNESINEKINA